MFVNSFIILQASGQPIGTLFNAIATLGLATGFALSFEWRTALVTLCFTPFIFVSIYLEQKILNANATKHNKPFEESSKVRNIILNEIARFFLINNILACSGSNK